MSQLGYLLYIVVVSGQSHLVIYYEKPSIIHILICGFMMSEIHTVKYFLEMPVLLTHTPPMHPRIKKYSKHEYT